MKKPYNVISKASLAAIFAASAIVPAATASAEALNPEMAKVVYEVDGKLVSVTMDEFENALLNEAFDIKSEDIKYIQLNDGKTYSMDEFENALLATDNAEEAVKKLAKDGKVADVTVVEGNYDKDGNVVINDETPEEKVNETFFYNLAA